MLVTITGNIKLSPRDLKQLKGATTEAVVQTLLGIGTDVKVTLGKPAPKKATTPKATTPEETATSGSESNEGNTGEGEGSKD